MIAVIILNWNGEKLLKEFLPSVIEATDPALADIIVADNGSTDGSLQLLRDEFPTVKVLSFPENLGFSGGYNRALRETGYKYTVLLNSDIMTPQGWLEPLHKFMEEHPDVAAVMPKIRSYRDRKMFEYAGASGGYIDRNGYPYCRGRIFATLEEDNGQYDTPAEVFWATGAAFMVRTDLYLEAGGLDERFFAHMEEIDLCWRLRLMGKQLWCVPASTVYHLGGGSLPAENPKKTYLNFRNNLLLLHKNLPAADLSATLLRRRLLDTIAWLKYILTLDFPNANSILRAHCDFRSMRREYTSHPDVNLLKTRLLPDEPGLRRLPDILVEYYLRGRRRFSQIFKRQ